MSKKNKVVYSDIQPNTKEAGVWVNTTDGNVMVEKDGKWVDDGGSSSGGEVSTVEYLLLSKNDSTILPAGVQFIMACALQFRIIYDNNIFIQPSVSQCVYGSFSDIYSNITAIAIDFNQIIIYPGFNGTIKEYLLEYYTKEELDAIPRMTKEEFYNLEV